MNFACPTSLTLAVAQKRRNFTTEPLQANDPTGYTEYLPETWTELINLGITRYFPPNWTLIPEVPLILPAGATPTVLANHIALVAERLRIKTKYDYVNVPPAVARIEALDRKLEAFNLASDLLPPGGVINPDLIFTVVDTQMMLAMNSSLAKHEGIQSKELTDVGAYLTNMKHTLSPFLAQLIDKNSKSDRPEPRSKNGILRLVLLEFEILCRGDSNTYNTIISGMFNSIGKADNVEQANFVLDQMDYTRNIYQAYIDSHPGQAEFIPTDKQYLYAICYRLSNSDSKLRELRKILEKLFKNPSTVYNYDDTVKELRIESGTQHIMIGGGTSLTTGSPSNNQISQLSMDVSPPRQQSLDYQSMYNLQNQFGYAAGIPQNQFHYPVGISQNQSSYVSGNPHTQSGFAATDPHYGYFMERPPTPSPQPIPNANYGFSQPNPNWPQQFRPTNPLPPQSKTCDYFPFCTYRQCRYSHKDSEGLDNPQLDAIQFDAYTSLAQSPPGTKWVVPPELKARFDALVAARPAHLRPLSTGPPVKKARHEE